MEWKLGYALCVLVCIVWLSLVYENLNPPKEAKKTKASRRWSRGSGKLGAGGKHGRAGREKGESLAIPNLRARSVYVRVRLCGMRRC